MAMQTVCSSAASAARYQKLNQKTYNASFEETLPAHACAPGALSSGLAGGVPGQRLLVCPRAPEHALVKICLFPSESGRRACISYAAAALSMHRSFPVRCSGSSGCSGLRDRRAGARRGPGRDVSHSRTPLFPSITRTSNRPPRTRPHRALTTPMCSQSLRGPESDHGRRSQG